MNKLALWERFILFIKDFIGFFSSEKKVNSKSADGYDPQKYLSSINSLYKHKAFKPKPNPPEEFSRLYKKTWIGYKIDVSKTRYKFDQPSFTNNIMRRFGR